MPELEFEWLNEPETEMTSWTDETRESMRRLQSLVLQHRARRASAPTVGAVTDLPELVMVENFAPRLHGPAGPLSSSPVTPSFRVESVPVEGPFREGRQTVIAMYDRCVSNILRWAHAYDARSFAEYNAYEFDRRYVTRGGGLDCAHVCSCFRELDEAKRIHDLLREFHVTVLMYACRRNPIFVEE